MIGAEGWVQAHRVLRSRRKGGGAGLQRMRRIRLAPGTRWRSALVGKGVGTVFALRAAAACSRASASARAPSRRTIASSSTRCAVDAPRKGGRGRGLPCGSTSTKAHGRRKAAGWPRARVQRRSSGRHADISGQGQQHGSQSVEFSCTRRRPGSRRQCAARRTAPPSCSERTGNGHRPARCWRPHAALQAAQARGQAFEHAAQGRSRAWMSASL